MTEPRKPCNVDSWGRCRTHGQYAYRCIDRLEAELSAVKADTLWAEYDSKVAPLWAEYDSKVAPLWAEYASRLTVLSVDEWEESERAARRTDDR